MAPPLEVQPPLQVTRHRAESGQLWIEFPLQTDGTNLGRKENKGPNQVLLFVLRRWWFVLLKTTLSNDSELEIAHHHLESPLDVLVSSHPIPEVLRGWLAAYRVPHTRS
jgi:hypothetical protein